MPLTPADTFTLNGRIPPRRVPFAYRATLGLSALAMVLLPLIYVGLIILTAYGVGLYAVHGLAVLDGPGAVLWRLMIYIGPLVTGVILVVFMIKPLFAPHERRSRPFELDLRSEPELRRLILSVCAKVGAPVPSRVEVDCQVNASARLRRGWLSLGRDDLVLTIGLPLAAGLNGRQFAGVLAHEFGHFAQGAGMAFSYVIRSINAWFARVVFERDDWDASLASAAREADTRLALILWLAIAAVGLSRQLLHGLMLAGHAVCCLQLRQMEFDADYYNVQIAGSAALGETAREVRRLATASQTALKDLGELWRQERLVDDFPGFVLRRRTGLPAEVLARADTAAAGVKTRWSDTHPSDLDREAQARALNVPGLYQGDGPATALFHDFAELSRTATQHLYREQFGLTLTTETLVRTDEAAQEAERRTAAQTALRRLCGTVPNLARPLVWSPADLQPRPPPADAASVARSLAGLRETLGAHREAAQTAEQLYQTLGQDLFNIDCAQAYREAQVPFKADGFGLLTGSATECERRRADVNLKLRTKAEELGPFEQAVHDWVATVARTAREPTLAAQLPGDLADRIVAATSGLTALELWLQAFPYWLRQSQLLQAFASSQQHLPDNIALARALGQMRAQGAQTVDGLFGLMGDAPYPLPNPAGPVTIAELLRSQVEAADVNARLPVAIREIATLYFQLLGQCAAFGEELERALATPPPVP